MISTVNDIRVIQRFLSDLGVPASELVDLVLGLNSFRVEQRSAVVSLIEDWSGGDPFRDNTARLLSGLDYDDRERRSLEDQLLELLEFARRIGRNPPDTFVSRSAHLRLGYSLRDGAEGVNEVESKDILENLLSGRRLASYLALSELRTARAGTDFSAPWPETTWFLSDLGHLLFELKYISRCQPSFGAQLYVEIFEPHWKSGVKHGDAEDLADAVWYMSRELWVRSERP
ncbi:hypothetical protein DFJ74DRAFT_75304 [Hyaloraphidium curvatum]|nr:hypothetical protein DFJ74DRAFT_75304 [Hyaloraphidium curvatum]